MKIFHILLLCSVSSVVFASENIHWSYDGETSPIHWGDLSEDFGLCKSGKNQSPINIENTYRSNIEHKIQIFYKSQPSNVVYNGHTVQVDNFDDKNYIILDGKKFILKQFHFHIPSENLVEGKNYPLELHFVNMSSDGQIVVVATMFDVGDENKELKKIWKYLPKNENIYVKIKEHIDLEQIIPNNKNYYRFSGSLTTPPCSEGVTWVVFKNNLSISDKQLNLLKNVFNNKSNNRPLQKINGRLIVED